jgi:aspartate oxidase
MDGTGRPLKILARAVVLATGGFAGAYRNRTAPSGLTGDGHAMAHAAGGRLMDLEFVQFMPTTLAFPVEFAGRVVTDALRGEGAVLLNSAGERFMARYDPALLDCAGRDVVAIAIATEAAQGRGAPHGGVYLDATALDERTLCALLGVGRGSSWRPGSIPDHAPGGHARRAFHLRRGLHRRALRTGVEGLYARAR